jgi:hypothetical protein
MNRLLIALLLLTGCLTPEHRWQHAGPVDMGGGPSDTTYLLAIDAASVGSAGAAGLAEHAVELERRYVRDVEVEGVTWQPMRSSTTIDEPDSYGSGGDSLLFTGYALAAWCWKYRVTGDSERVVEALRGLWVLTHAAGKGVLSRCAFPTDRAAEWGWPDAWARDAQFVGQTPAGVVEDLVRGGTLPAMTWYTRATKDQMTGLVMGLACAWDLARETSDLKLATTIRAVVRTIVQDVLAHLRAHGWRIRDAHGNNDTSADDVDDLLRLSLLCLARAAGLDVEEEYQLQFGQFVGTADLMGTFDRYNNVQQYYAHTLRASRSFVLWLLDTDPIHRERVVAYASRHWRRWTDGHGNAWLAWLWAVMSGETPGGEGARALHELRLKPTRLWSSPLAGRWEAPTLTAATLDTTSAWALPVYLRKPTAYFAWQKEPWDPGELPYDTLGLGETTGVDFLAAYWLGRAHGFID